MADKIYAIIDVETTGGKASRDRITEIGIVLHDGEKVLDQYQSLVNPECTIPYGITELTGISQDMVKDAPKFYEIAKEIVEWTDNTIFVAHNVRFDYGFIREEFKRLGYTFTKKQLCTVRLSRKAFPGLPSYALGNLIRHFKISVNDRHRALDDALATAEIFGKIMAIDRGEETADNMINLGMRETKFPVNLNLEMINALPEECGVYYMHDADGKVVYVGKSLNIKKRVISHFGEQTNKAAKLHQMVEEITYELTGSELVALLFESHEIKRLRPKVNRAQRTRRFPFAIYYYYNDEGFLCFGYKKILASERTKYHILTEYPKIWNAKNRLRSVTEELELCASLTGIQQAGSPCFNYHIGKCRGVCVGKESYESYNERAQLALEAFTSVFHEDFIVVDEGRSLDELAVILVKDGRYRGFGYVDKAFAHSVEDMIEAVKIYEDNPETRRIIQRYVSDGKGRVVKL